MTTGAWILVAAVVLALAVGLWRAATDGRFRGTHEVRGGRSSGVETPGRSSGVENQPRRSSGVETPAELTPGAALVAEVGETLGERATLLQFSSAFCAPCRATRRVLADVAEVVPGVAHVEVDAEHHLEPGPPRRRAAHADHARPRRRRHGGDPGRRGAPQGAGARGTGHHRLKPCPRCGTTIHIPRRGNSAGRRVLRVHIMSSTWLTKRRAVDHCRVRSALCRMR